MAALGLGLLSATAQAETPLSALEFEAYVTGQTMTFARKGVIYGAEQYLPDRQVVWRHQGGECKEGQWVPVGTQICFTYAPDIGPECWEFFRRDGRLGARSVRDPEGLVLYELARSPEPLDCPALYLGS